MKEHDYIAVIDFGSQFAHLIARRIRQHNVLAKIFTPDMSAAAYKDARGIVLSGGPSSTIDESAVQYDPGLFKLNVPILGLCYGHQLIAQYFKGKVEKGITKEYGQADVEVADFSDIFKGLNSKERVWMSHWDVVTKQPAGFEIIGSTQDCPVAAMRNSEKKIWSFQFHLEVHHTEHGMKMLENFLFGICNVKADWNIAAIEKEIIKDIRSAIPKAKHVFLLVSGGVDSTVAFALLEKALGKNRVYGLHVDNGFMRLRESIKVGAALKKAGFSNLHTIDAGSRFLRAVQGMIDPEEKRQAIGELFVEIANEEMIKLDIDKYILGQGTIYPDTIESGGTKHADTIKTHHNRIDLIQEMINEGKVVEPLKDLYKDEVREIGKRFKIAKGLLKRQPFPGPGLAIRALCSDGDSPIEDEQKINGQLKNIVSKVLGSDSKTTVTATVLPLKSVGVQGDERSYKHPVVISGKASWKQLNDLSVRITNEVFAVNRVLWLVQPKKLNTGATIRERYMTQDRLDLLRVADDIVMSKINEHKVFDDIWQFPVVLVPYGNPGTSGESIVLRPIQSREAMTVNFYEMPLPILTDILRALKEVRYIDYIFYDITHKPPATIEWE